MKSIDPTNQKLLQRYTVYGEEKVNKIIDLVYASSNLWRNSLFTKRVELLKRLADNIRDKKDELAKLITKEVGKLLSESSAEIEKSINLCLFYAENSEQFMKEQFVETRYSKSYTTFHPLGVILAVMPWNFPVWQVVRCMIPAIMSGNGGLLKHASNVSGCALEIENLFLASGFPENLFRTLLLPSEDVVGVIQNPKIAAVTLTGSDLTGSVVAAEAGKMIKKSVLELGGSDPFIVLADADVISSADKATKSRLYNMGQACTAAKRFIVDRKIASSFIDRMKQRMSAMRVGDPMDTSTSIAPLARHDILQKIDTQVKSSITLGAKLEYGGKKYEHLKGNYYQPTILSNVTHGMPVFDEETFGPVAAITVVEDYEEAIEVANSTVFGLSGSVWTGDVLLGEQIARRLDCGSVYVNSIPSSDLRLPFGGIKRSGYGRELSDYGLREFVNVQSVYVD